MKNSTTGVTGIGLNALDTICFVFFSRNPWLVVGITVKDRPCANCEAFPRLREVIALLVAPALVDVNHYRPQIESKLRDRLGREVSLGPMKLSLIPLAFCVENSESAEDPA